MVTIRKNQTKSTTHKKTPLPLVSFCFILLQKSWCKFGAKFYETIWILSNDIQSHLHKIARYKRFSTILNATNDTEITQRDNLCEFQNFREPLFTWLSEYSAVAKRRKMCTADNAQATRRQQKSQFNERLQRDVFLLKRKASLSFYDFRLTLLRHNVRQSSLFMQARLCNNYVRAAQLRSARIVSKLCLSTFDLLYIYYVYAYILLIFVQKSRSS